jgi:hypothetical protein
LKIHVFLPQKFARYPVLVRFRVTDGGQASEPAG